ncbi:MAG: Type IV-A pilus assembly ATPase PilB [Candidatus Uhrbacteria bacterium GW2011_GWE2_40_58]|nr:MAG: Type IV-A pilus assembly ATPase PilB [Candidatus Uhrbacteria bacterium GW2011_GWF2_40_263]KKR67907.1 MAG: Type IV-A pilus assembly ATPase PilB [Candidatus Uhrbacteria bacterium GW2011_GWE2_40_58]OGL92507.1 MAG: hypothetical protein A2239_01695 [Candidatus Uhrbacteria bacterium RIFOXYA2_FULL_40_9]OGL96876.1 MAG: hypothetical protein A2332_02030 [Candidatus Uhrbacteria bacterium RIFOXYB2_FULL_41_18]HBK34529.1 type II secretion system protein GspE [Candidatus Uhrbacteria bacterium]
MPTFMRKKSSESLKKETAKPVRKKLVYPNKKEVEDLIKQAEQGISKTASTDLFQAIMMYAHAARSSDVHLEPGEKTAVARLRIDGILRDEFFIPNQVHHQLISLLKILTHMRTDEHRAPQDGRYRFQVPNGDVDVRVSVMAVSDGEKSVLRLLSSESHKLTLEDLGFGKTDYERVSRAILKPWGMILSTGPTGSGKTTTIYAILEMLNKRTVNISTIEDPVEFYISGVNQSQVDHAAKVTFANGLRTLLRQDPDIIMVGEIRDEETAKIAVNAALTGHKMLSTLHTNNAATTIPRLLDMNVEPFLVSSTLILSIAQRLMRRVCPECVGEKTLTRDEAKQILEEGAIEELFQKKNSITLAQAKGCNACNDTGYKGRIGIFEVLEVSEEIQKMIIRRATSSEIEKQAINEGMTTLMRDGAQKVLGKETTLEELIRVMYE